MPDFISIALSFCSNWGSFDHHPNPEIMSSFQQMHDPEMAAEILMTFDGNSTLAHYDLLLDPTEFCYADNYGSFLPYLPNPGLVPESLPEFLTPLPVSSYSCNQHTPESYMKNPASRASLSAQSIAACERRRKITEKTQELGKRIPGGNKLNTAEMFHAAFKYVKYLQAQVALLQIMGSVQMQEKEPFMHTKELQDHLASPLIQEKLYLEAKCLLPI